MKNRIAIFATLLLAPLAALRAADKPNVIVFLMDDLGWNDLGYGRPHTPAKSSCGKNCSPRTKGWKPT